MDKMINTGYADRLLWTNWWTCISNKKPSNYKNRTSIPSFTHPVCFITALPSTGMHN